MITTVIFDIGNVLAKFPWRIYLHEFGFSKEIEDRIAEALFLSEVWKEADRGVLSDEEIFSCCKEKIPDLEKELTRVWENRINIVEEFPHAKEWIKELKEKGYQVYLLSNYAETTFAQAEKTFEFLKYVDGKVISYEIKKVKPEKEIYEELIKRYLINPREAVFLDDLLENLETAKQMGFETILVKECETAKKELDLLLKEKGKF